MNVANIKQRTVLNVRTWAIFGQSLSDALLNVWNNFLSDFLKILRQPGLKYSPVQQFSLYTLVLVIVSIELLITASSSYTIMKTRVNCIDCGEELQCWKLFQKSLRALFHSSLQLFFVMVYDNLKTYWTFMI